MKPLIKIKLSQISSHYSRTRFCVLVILLFSLVKTSAQKNSKAYGIFLNQKIDFFVDERIWDSVLKYESIYKKLVISNINLKDTTYAKSIERASSAYFYKGYLVLAEENIIDALKIYETYKLNKRASYSYLKIGNINLEYKKYDKAKHYFTNAYSYFKSVNDTIGVASSCLNLFDIYFYEKKYDSAFHVLKQVASLPNSFRHKRVKAHQLLADLFAFQHQYDSAIHYLNNVNSYNIKFKIQDERLPDMYARYFKVFHETKQKQLAKEYAYKTYKSSQATNSLKSKALGYECMYKYFEMISKLDSAFCYVTKYHTYNDSIYNNENLKKATEQEIRYTYEKKQLEEKSEYDRKELKRKEDLLQQQEQLNAKQRFIILSLIGSMLLAIVLLYVLRERRKIKAKLEIEEKNTAQQKQHFSAFIQGQEEERKRMSAELHDGLCQHLAVVKMLLSNININNNETELTKINTSANKIGEIIDEVRELSHNMMPSTLVELGLVKALKSLTDAINTANSIQITLQTFQQKLRIDKKMEIHVYRIIQELTQNIIKHAKATTASITLEQTEEKLNVEVTDNGIGIQNTNNKEGIGWKNIYSRTTILNGTITFISPKNEGTKVVVSIPLP